MTTVLSYTAFEQLTSFHEPGLRNYCWKLAGSEWDGDDLYQETMIKAFRRFQRWPERELSKPYLYRIAANAWFDVCRRRKIALVHGSIADQMNFPMQSGAGTTSENRWRR
ncbi:RNA polymerase sigma factor [Paenibacillus cymbidii]|uniref:RNA polymerase sigma factor n=1 Tax=Paenibacillus cymbidii TaxID=1639034 RepID=UPI00107FE87D|nr:RNA polymerase sigma factor [Paenibacillus cymbidii]